MIGGASAWTGTAYSATIDQALVPTGRSNRHGLMSGGHECSAANLNNLVGVDPLNQGGLSRLRERMPMLMVDRGYLSARKGTTAGRYAHGRAEQAIRARGKP